MVLHLLPCKDVSVPWFVSSNDAEMIVKAIFWVLAIHSKLFEREIKYLFHFVWVSWAAIEVYLYRYR